MADPLSLLRQFNVGKREIIQRGNFVCFGDNCWPKTTNTNYLVYGFVLDSLIEQALIVDVRLHLQLLEGRPQ